MFYFVMAYLFWHRSADRLSRLVMTLMLIIDLQCIKDLFFLPNYILDDELWTIMTSTDMVAVPFYGFIIMELCRPGFVTVKLMTLHLLPFVVIPVLFVLTGNYVIYVVNVVFAAVYGVACSIWTIFAIRRYNIILKQQFSYDDNINLDWLRMILVFFFFILSLWVVDCIAHHVDVESLYMLGSMMMWAFLGYFIYRHESVINNLSADSLAKLEIVQDDLRQSDRIQRLFENDKIYLNPNLKLSAMMVGTNRTYVSRYFNAEQDSSFFDFVNGYRIRTAIDLLRSTDDKIEIIAERSGFNSRQSLHRVFTKVVGLTPERFRLNEKKCKSGD